MIEEISLERFIKEKGILDHNVKRGAITQDDFNKQVKALRANLLNTYREHGRRISDMCDRYG